MLLPLVTKVRVSFQARTHEGEGYSSEIAPDKIGSYPCCKLGLSLRTRVLGSVGSVRVTAWGGRILLSIAGLVCIIVLLFAVGLCCGQCPEIVSWSVHVDMSFSKVYQVPDA